ncbi:uncharacterized protein LOC128206290 [Mya arenaria]|nr:uncharacterized protein LOC128206290 [Mya arenaria]
MVEPIGWASMRSSLHYRTVFPEMPDVGTHQTLHKNLSKRLQPRDMIAFNQNNIDMARRILHRQRVALRLYSGSRLSLKGSTAHQTSARLHRQPLRQYTCPDGFNRENSETFSNMRSEGSTLLTEASLYGPPGTREGARDHFHGGRGMSPIPGSARSMFSDHNALPHDPEKAPDSRGYVVKLKRPIVYKKKYTESEVQNIVRRLTDYDPLTHPAESRGQVRERPAVVAQVPRQSMVQIKKCSAEEVQQIVERLYTYDNNRWPAESKARLQIHSGRPRQIQTAPAGQMKKQEDPATAPSSLAPSSAGHHRPSLQPIEEGAVTDEGSHSKHPSVSEDPDIDTRSKADTNVSESEKASKL